MTKNDRRLRQDRVRELDQIADAVQRPNQEEKITWGAATAPKDESRVA